MFATNPQQETKKIVAFIKKTLKRQGFKRLVVAVSGGVDSATTAFLATRAIGVNNLYVLQLPYNGQSTHLSNLVIKKLKIPGKNIFKVNITSVVDTIINLINPLRERNDLGAPGADKLTKGNIIVRVRMIIIFDMAKRLSALVCGTENRSEHLLGYFTRYGDSACDLEPIQHLYKTQVWQLAKYLGIPSPVIAAKPTAGLWPDQTDEKELGFGYGQADEVLNYLFDDRMKINEIEQKCGRDLTRKVLGQVKANLFKQQVPYKISND